MLSQVQMWVCCKFGIVNAFSTDDLLPCNGNVNIPSLSSLNVSSIVSWRLANLLGHVVPKKKKSRSTSRGSKGSVDWWLDGFSGELWRARHNSHASIKGSDVLIREKEAPLKVLHLRNLPWECTEEEHIELEKPFGKVVNTKCNIGANRNQAFIEFSEQNQAIAMISYYASSSEPAQVRGKSVSLQYSNRQEIMNNKTSANVARNVLLVTIEGSDARSFSIDVLHLVLAYVLVKLCCLTYICKWISRHISKIYCQWELIALEERAHDLDKEQALVCITVAFLCLKKPALQPSMKEIVAMLSGDL
nr:polypyrimidine tract-binding protein homolog 2-like isoform X1 [Tanacetum cinerariifolium]